MKAAKLPKHLQDIIDARNAKAAEFGIDLDWAAKAHAKAVKTGNDFNPIFGLVG